MSDKDNNYTEEQYEEEYDYDEAYSYPTKKDKILFFSGIALAVILLVCSIVFIYQIHVLKWLAAYEIFVAIFLILLSGITAFTQFFKIPGIITKVIALVLSVVLAVGTHYIGATNSFLSKTTGTNTKVTKMSIYVLKDNAASTVEDIVAGSFGIISETERDKTDEVIDKINAEFSTTIATVEYTNAESLAGALLEGSVDAIIMNESYISIVSDTYEDFESLTKKLSTYEKKETVTDSATEDTNDDVISIYFSGVDIDGLPSDNRNSDVNIICTINKKTHQILLLNTPRDYYIPITVSNGVPDKLTHAGIYGIDCSIGTLEMLYGIDIDYYVKVNFTGFVNIIDSLGGIDVNSTYEFTAYHGGYHFYVGMNHMDGQIALGFARERYSFADGDNQRGRNEMAVITAIIKKFCSTDMLMNYTSILGAISDCMVTSLPSDVIADLVQFQLDEMPEWDIQQYAVNGTGDRRDCFSLTEPNDVTVPDYNTVNQAIEYLNAMYDNQVITVQ